MSAMSPDNGIPNTGPLPIRFVGAPDSPASRQPRLEQDQDAGSTELFVRSFTAVRRGPVDRQPLRSLVGAGDIDYSPGTQTINQPTGSWAATTAQLPRSVPTLDAHPQTVTRTPAVAQQPSPSLRQRTARVPLARDDEPVAARDVTHMAGGLEQPGYRTGDWAEQIFGVSVAQAARNIGAVARRGFDALATTISTRGARLALDMSELSSVSSVNYNVGQRTSPALGRQHTKRARLARDDEPVTALNVVNRVEKDPSPSLRQRTARVPLARDDEPASQAQPLRPVTTAHLGIADRLTRFVRTPLLAAADRRGPDIADAAESQRLTQWARDIGTELDLIRQSKPPKRVAQDNLVDPLLTYFCATKGVVFNLANIQAEAIRLQGTDLERIAVGMHDILRGFRNRASFPERTGAGIRESGHCVLTSRFDGPQRTRQDAMTYVEEIDPATHGKPGVPIFTLRDYVNAAFELLRSMEREEAQQADVNRRLHAQDVETRFEQLLLHGCDNLPGLLHVSSRLALQTLPNGIPIAHPLRDVIRNTAQQAAMDGVDFNAITDKPNLAQIVLGVRASIYSGEPPIDVELDFVNELRKVILPLASTTRDGQDLRWGLSADKQHLLVNPQDVLERLDRVRPDHVRISKTHERAGGSPQVVGIAGDILFVIGDKQVSSLGPDDGTSNDVETQAPLHALHTVRLASRAQDLRRDIAAAISEWGDRVRQNGEYVKIS